MAKANSPPGQPAVVNRMTKRYWRRRDGQRAGWWPWGWLPSLGLAGLFTYGAVQTAPAIEAQTEQQVQSVLRDGGLADFTVEADGQEVFIQGTGSAADGDRALALALTTACETWVAGQRVCPNTVRVAVTPSDVQPAAVVPVVEPAPAPATRFHNFNFRETGEGLTVSGEVPDDVTHDAILAAARAAYGSVTDELIVSDETASAGFGWAVDRALPMLARLTEGEVAWRDGSLSAAGRVAEADEAGVRRDFASTAFPSRIGALTLRTLVPDVDTCNEQFTAALAQTSIVFRIGSTTISPASQGLIEELAALAAECPTRLRIEGHTDSAGSAELNTSLSLARAEAVAAALAGLGIDAARLTAEGFGASQPIADNATAAGRARNRRIEIRAVDEQP